MKELLAYFIKGKRVRQSEQAHYDAVVKLNASSDRLIDAMNNHIKALEASLRHEHEHNEYLRFIIEAKVKADG